MGTQLTDAERAAIENEIMAQSDEIWSAVERADVERIFADFSDAYGLGFIYTGVFIPTRDALVAGFHAGYGDVERQEITGWKERRIAVLAPNVAVVINLMQVTVFSKDGTTFTGPFAHTTVCAKVDGEWKIVHHHQSIPPQT